MIKRELKNYTWQYEDGKVYLLKKTNAIGFVIPIDKADSVIRALISFKNSWRIEQNIKVQKRTATYKLFQARIRKRTIEKIKKDKDIHSRQIQALKLKLERQKGQNTL